MVALPFLATLLYFWTLRVKAKLAIRNQSKVIVVIVVILSFFFVVYPRVSLHPGPHTLLKEVVILSHPVT